jgi:hypothetical protein
MRKLFTLFFIVASTFMFPQATKQALIVVHVEVPVKAEFKQKIYAYHFLNGHFTGREEVLVVNGKQGGKDYIRTDLGGPCTLYKDRYMITGIGNIIDLKDKKILFDGRANLVRCSNDSAIFYTNDFQKGKYYSVYNFKTNTYGEVKNLTFKAKLGQDVEYDKTAMPIKLALYPANKPKIELVKDAGYGQKTADGKIPDPPMWWIDNSTFIYTHYNQDNSEISFFKVNVDTKSSTLLGKIPFKPGTTAPIVTKEDKYVTTLNYGDKMVMVNSKTDKVEELSFTYPINGFAAEVKSTPQGRRILLANNQKELGKYPFQLKNFKSSEKTVALVRELIVGTDSYQQGMAVWNYDQMKFEKVDADEVLTMVGWINEQ